VSKTVQTTLLVATKDESTDAQTPQPNLVDGTAEGDPSAAYCEGCDRHLPHGVPDIGRVVGKDGTIPACARSDCDGIESRGNEYTTHTHAALEARQRAQGARTAARGTRK